MCNRFMRLIILSSTLLLTNCGTTTGPVLPQDMGSRRDLMSQSAEHQAYNEAPDSITQMAPTTIPDTYTPPVQVEPTSSKGIALPKLNFTCITKNKMPGGGEFSATESTRTKAKQLAIANCRASSQHPDDCFIQSCARKMGEAG